MVADNYPTLPAPDTNYCIDKSIDYTPVGGSGLSYGLVITRNDVSYQTTDSTPPFITMPITGIGAITGVAQVGQTLTSGAIAPVDATVSYQWQSAPTADGTYTNISGAVLSSYTLTSNEESKYIKVSVTGVGSYNGTQSSESSSQVAADPNWIKIGSQTWARANLNVGVLVDGSIANQGADAYLWTSTNGGTSAWHRYIVPIKTNVYRSAYPKSAGFSVRCLKN